MNPIEIVTTFLGALFGYYFIALSEIFLFLFVWGDEIPRSLVDATYWLGVFPGQLIPIALFGYLGYMIAHKLSR